MSSRTTTSTVTFERPFRLGENGDAYPAGAYEVIAEDEPIQSVSFPASRRLATHLLIKGPKGSGRSELRAIDHRELELALARDQAATATNHHREAAQSPSKDSL